MFHARGLENHEKCCSREDRSGSYVIHCVMERERAQHVCLLLKCFMSFLISWMFFELSSFFTNLELDFHVRNIHKLLLSCLDIVALWFKIIWSQMQLDKLFDVKVDSTHVTKFPNRPQPEDLPSYPFILLPPRIIQKPKTKGLWNPLREEKISQQLTSHNCLTNRCQPTFSTLRNADAAKTQLYERIGRSLICSIWCS